MSGYMNCYKKVMEVFEIVEPLSFPIDIKLVIETYFPEIYVASYSDIGLSENARSKNLFATTFVRGAQSIIAYDETLEEDKKRFALSHELGHILLRHPYNTQGMIVNNKLKENQANCFARNLLCPVFAVDGLNANHLQEKFGISYQAASARDDFFEIDCYHMKNVLSIMDVELVIPTRAELQQADINYLFGNLVCD